MDTKLISGQSKENEAFDTRFSLIDQIIYFTVDGMA